MLCHSFTKCTANGPNYRRSLSSSWKQARSVETPPCPVEKIESRRVHVGTIFRFKIQASIFLWFVRIYRDVYNWSIINLWSEIFVIEDSLLDHRSLFLTRSNQSILLFIFLFFIILIYYINLFINIKIFTYLLHKYKLTIMVLLILNNPPVQFLLLLILLLLDFRLADLYSRIFRIDNSFYS